MKSSLFVLILASCATFAWSQATPSSPTPAGGSAQNTGGATSPTGGLKLRGPDAVAQQDPNKVVATIDGHPITAQQAATMLKQVPEEQRRNMPNLSTLLEQLFIIDHFAEEAEKLKLDQQSPWKEQLRLERSRTLAQAYISDLGKNPGTQGPNAQQYYDAHSSDYEQVKLSGILVQFNPPGTPASSATVSRTEADAKTKADDIEKKIKDGGDFSALARTDSDQQQSAAQGGALGTYMMGDAKLPPDIKAAVTKLQVGQVSEPVRVPGGFFILKLEAKNKVPFDQVRPTIVQKLEMEKYKIQVQDPDFFASSPAPPSNIPSLQRPPTAPTPPSTPSATKPPSN